MEIADLIKRERKRLGWSQLTLSKRLGVSKGLVSQWEAGHSDPPIMRLLDLCAAFGLSPRAFLGRSDKYGGQLVEDADELLLLRLWRQLPEAERTFFVRQLRGVVRPPDDDGKP